MRKPLAAAALSLLACLASPLLHAAAVPDRIVTASERGTYIEIGRDLARLVALPAGVPLEVLPSKGSAENVHRLRTEAGVRLALVQSDVYRAYLDQAAAGDVEAGRLVKPLRVVMPLYDEEIYFVVRADSPLRSVSEIRGQHINLGPVGSGTALTATTAYNIMFGSAPAPNNSTYLSNEEALVKLTTDKSIDVVVIVAGQPAKLFAQMKPEARQYIKLLAVDPDAPQTHALAGTYTPAAIRAASYPNWLSQDVPAIAVKSMLVTYDFPPGPVRDSLTKIARSMCVNFDHLRANGHAKWQEVSLTLPMLPKGWSYYGPTQKVLSNCAAQQDPHASVAHLAAPVPDDAACTQSRALLGLCRPASAR